MDSSNALRGTQLNVSEAQAVGRFGHSQKVPAADIVFAMGPDLDPRYKAAFERDAYQANVDMESLGDGVNGIDLGKFKTWHESGRIRPNTQIVLFLHGEKDDRHGHTVLVAPGVRMPTSQLTGVVRNRPGASSGKDADSSNTASTKEAWKGTVNLVSCWAKDYTDDARRKQDAQDGPVLSHGEGYVMTELHIESISDLIYYVGECKRQGRSVEATGTFLNAAQPTARRPEATPLRHTKLLRQLWSSPGASSEVLQQAIGSDPGLLNASTRFGYTPLHVAVDKRNLDAVKILLAAKAPLDARHAWQGSPLILACKNNDQAIVTLLVAAGANVNLGDADGNTPLHFAVKAFVEKYENPVHIPSFMSYWNYLDLARTLTEAKADPAIRNNAGMSALSIAQDFKKVNVGAGAALVALLQPGKTPLHLACMDDDKAAVGQLIEAGADVNAGSADGNTPLHIACMTRGNEHIIRLLIKAGADATLQNADGDTPLHVMCRNSKPDEKVFFELIDGKSVNVQDAEGATPLLVLCKSRLDQQDANELEKSVAYVGGLIAAGADVNIGDKSGSTPLHVICGSDRMEMKAAVDVLIGNRADCNLQDVTGNTPLHVACMSNSGAVIALINAGSDPNVGNALGDTPLHILCKPVHLDRHMRKMQLALAAELIAKGANPHARNRAGKSVLSLIESPELLKVLSGRSKL